MTSRSALEVTPVPPAKVREPHQSDEGGPPESFADALNAMELAFSSVLCSVNGCNVSPVRGRFCKEHKPRFIENEELLPPLDRALVVLERNPELNDAGVQWIAKVNKATVKTARAIYRAKIRRKIGKRSRNCGKSGKKVRRVV